MGKDKLTRIAIVGCGGFSKNYLPVYRNFENTEISICCDADITAAQSMAKMLGARKASADFSDVVAAEVDYVVLSTPNFLHVEQASALIDSGKHVLLQKPLARNVAEASQLLSILEKNRNLQIGMYMSMLDFGLWWELRNAISNEKVLGSVAQISMRLGHTGGLLWNSEAKNLWRFSKEKTGGGAFIMLGVHYIHFLRWLLGSKLTRVCAQVSNLHCPRIEGEDICQIQAEMENGTLVQLSVAWNSQGEHFAIYGTEGSLVYLDNELLRIHGVKPWKTSYFEYTELKSWQNFDGIVPPPLDDGQNSYNQHRAFLEAVRTNSKPAVDLVQGYWDMLVTEAVYKSASNGGWETVSYE